MIGNFKIKPREQWKSELITEDVNEAFYYHLKFKGSMIDVRKINDKNYYQIYSTSIKSKEETDSPIYKQILELEAIELHKFTKIIEQNKGYILDLSTDSVSCVFVKEEFPFNIDIQPDGKQYINGFYMILKTVYTNTNQKIKINKKKQRLTKFIETSTFEHTETKFNIIQDVPDNNVKPLVDHFLKNNMSIHIDGPTGAGKSTLMNQLQAEMTKREFHFIHFFLLYVVFFLLLLCFFLQ